MLSSTVRPEFSGNRFTVLFILAILFLLLLSDLSVLAQQASIWDRFPEDIKSRNWFKRFEWFYQQRAFPYDTIPQYEYINNINLEKEKHANRINNGNLPIWTSIGPNGTSSILSWWGIESGRVRAIAIHPSDPDIIYIGASNGGIWKSTNGGSEWLNIVDDLESLSYGAIAIDPNNPDVIYSGSGEVSFFTGIIHFDGRGLYKSIDGGQSWVQITNGFGVNTHFGDIAVSPFSSNIVIAALASGYYYLGNNLPNEGIWRSQDSGDTWIKTLDVPDAYDIVFHPTDPNRVYVAVGGMNLNSGFYISYDAGITWQQSNSGLQSPETIARMQLDISLSNPDIIYAVIYEMGSGILDGTTKAYKSFDGGLNWTQISVGTPLGGNYGDGWVDQGFYDLTIAVNPMDPNHVLIGNIELHETTDGQTFFPRRTGPNAFYSVAHVDYQKLVFSISQPSYLYVGCDGGIYKSTNTGSTFASINLGLGTLQFYRIASNPNNASVVVGGTQDNGTSLTYNYGSTWSEKTGGDGMECLFNPNNSSTLYTSAQNGYLMRSTNGGSNFSFIYNVNGAWVTPFFLDSENPDYIYTANKSILRSTNAGTSFDNIALNVAPVSISTFTQSKVNPDNMIFACGGGDIPQPDTTVLVKVSTDAGFTWTDITSNVPGESRWVSRVATDPLDANTMYILRTGFSSGNKLYKTTDLGLTWTNLSGDLPDLPCSDVFIYPSNPNYIFIANDVGVYMTSDGGTNWVYASDGMPFVPCFDFDFVKIGTSEILRVGTHGRSIYESHIENVVPVELTTFTATSQKDFVELNWTTATEINNQGFEVQRNTTNSEFVTVGFVEGNGTTTEEHHYSFKDKDVSGFIRYRLKQVDFDGSYEYSDIVEVEVLGNLSYELAQNYPNPFNPITNISYTLPAESQVKLSIYNTLGELVETIVNEKQDAGKYDAVWNARNHPSGVYIYTLDAVSLSGNKQTKLSRKMLLLK